MHDRRPAAPEVRGVRGGLYYFPVIRPMCMRPSAELWLAPTATATGGSPPPE
jgi:hypothetical protein